MPKEYIVTNQEQRTRDAQGGRRSAVSIGWDRVGYVQIATILRAGTEGSPVPCETECDEGWFIDLDRESINRLIRTLRKARDQAYGTDA